MQGFVDQCVRLIETHQAWAGVVVGLLAFGESLILIGILLPGTTVLVIVGGLAGAGLIHPLPVVLAAIVGASLGDVVSYYLGTWLGRGVVHKWPLNRHRQEVARARLFFRRYGFAAIFLGRFFGPVRATVPLVAGMMGMNRSRFQLANILSALVWAPAILMPGWLVAKGAGELIQFNATNILLLAAVVIVAAIIAALVGIKLLARGRRSRERT
jgi:membrane protein DedA with SNARE-associated domain